MALSRKWLAYTAALCLGLFTSCSDLLHEPTEAELSAFREYVYALDTAALQKGLERVLSDNTDAWLTDAGVRQHYVDADSFEVVPLWFDRMGVSADADSLLAYLRREVPRNGLDTTAFFVPQIAADLAVVKELAFDSLQIDINELLPRLDYNLSRAFVRYTVGMRYGFVRPSNLLNHLDYRADRQEYALLFDYKIVLPTDSEAVVKLMSNQRMDFLSASKPDNRVYEVLQQRLAESTDSAERRVLAINMERCRWQRETPTEQGRQVVVNIAAQQLWAVGADSVLDMRICCGRTISKTPLLYSQISYMQVNPEWVIPHSIIKNEMTHHAGDSAYFARHRYYIVNCTNGDTVDPSSVTAAQLRSGNMRIAQRGGAGNSLGRIVFRFPNDFSVYLHDTNSPSAFKRDVRTLSHGCVRVEKPFELAQFLLPSEDEWTLDKIRISMDLKPQTEQGRRYIREHAGDSRPFRLVTYRDVKPTVPLYIIYYTAYPNPSSGKLELWPDIYGYDKVIAGSMQSILIK